MNQLTAKYVEACAQKEHALFDGDVRTANKCVDRIFALGRELARRSGDGRQLLFAFYGHESIEVRLNVARDTLALDSQRASTALQEIASSGVLPQAADAAGLLMMLADGTYAIR